MESVAASAAILASPSPISLFSPSRTFSKRPSFLPIASKHKGDEADLHSDSESTNLVPFLNNNASISPLSKDAAMGLVLNAAAGRGWTTGSGMEGPSMPADLESPDRTVSTFPLSLFTNSPRRRMLVAFTCNVCGQRTTRAINPHAYTDGTVFVQVSSDRNPIMPLSLLFFASVFKKIESLCKILSFGLGKCCGCNVFHKLVDYLNLFHEMKCYVNPSFRYKGDTPFNYLDEDDGDDQNIFPIL